MFIKTVKIDNFKGRTRIIPLTRTSILTGGNSAGKSSVIQAIRYALSGENDEGSTAAAAAAFTTSGLGGGVEITSDTGDTLEREIDATGKAVSESIRLNGRKIKARDSESEIQTTFGDAARSWDVANLARISNAKSRDYISGLVESYGIITPDRTAAMEQVVRDCGGNDSDIAFYRFDTMSQMTDIRAWAALVTDSKTAVNNHNETCRRLKKAIEQCDISALPKVSRTPTAIKAELDAVTKQITAAGESKRERDTLQSQLTGLQARYSRIVDQPIPEAVDRTADIARLKSEIEASKSGMIDLVAAARLMLWIDDLLILVEDDDLAMNKLREMADYVQDPQRQKPAMTAKLEWELADMERSVEVWKKSIAEATANNESNNTLRGELKRQISELETKIARLPEDDGQYSELNNRRMPLTEELTTTTKSIGVLEHADKLEGELKSATATLDVHKACYKSFTEKHAESLSSACESIVSGVSDRIGRIYQDRKLHLDLSPDAGIAVGLESPSGIMPLSAMGGGESVALMAILSAHLQSVYRTGLRIVSVEASEIDDAHMESFLDAMGEIAEEFVDCQFIISTWRPVDAFGWDVVNMEKE